MSYFRLPVVSMTAQDKNLGLRVYCARSFLSRTLGLLFARPLQTGEALWLEPCGSVHTLGMNYAIDVVFLDRERRIVDQVESLPPSRLAGRRLARSVLELPARAARGLGLERGMELRVGEVS